MDVLLDVGARQQVGRLLAAFDGAVDHVHVATLAERLGGVEAGAAVHAVVVLQLLLADGLGAVRQRIIAPVSSILLLLLHILSIRVDENGKYY